jgi:hypothetical protein
MVGDGTSSLRGKQLQVRGACSRGAPRGEHSVLHRAVLGITGTEDHLTGGIEASESPNADEQDSGLSDQDMAELQAAADKYTPGAEKDEEGASPIFSRYLSRIGIYADRESDYERAQGILLKAGCCV